jgi:hypothetical protein
MKKTFAVFSTLVVLALLFSGCSQQGGPSAACNSSSGPVCGANGITYGSACLAAAANVTVKSTGACIMCTDSDGGRNLSVFGTAKSGTTTVSDSCAGPSKVNESYCSGTSIDTAVSDCPSGMQCESGACAVSCTDSDFGKVAATKGTVALGNMKYTDSCVSAQYLTEYYCENNSATSAQMDCGAGDVCTDGACVEACTDSDGGINASVKGTVKNGSLSYTDTCDENRVVEYYCENGNAQYQAISCPTGSKCDNGRCAEIKCTDTDGKDTTVKGTLTYGDVTYTDSCYSASAVTEYSCAAGAPSSSVIACGSGNECANGKCAELTCRKTVSDISEDNKRYLIAALGRSDEFSMEVGTAVELNGSYMMKLDDIVTDNASGFLFYKSLASYYSNSKLCNFTLATGVTNTTICGKKVPKVTVTDSDGSTAITFRSYEYNVIEAYSAQGEITDWTDNAACDADEYYFDSYSAEFFPYMATDSSSIDLTGETFWFMGQNATIKDVSEPSVTFVVGNKRYILENGDVFTYMGEDYDITLLFNDYGLSRMDVAHD